MSPPTKPWPRPLTPGQVEATRHRLMTRHWVEWTGAGERVWKDTQNEGTLWVEDVGGVEMLVAGDADGVRVMEIPTALLAKFVRMERAQP